MGLSPSTSDYNRELNFPKRASTNRFGAARATRAASADAVRIYGITVMPGATDITAIEHSPSATDHYYTLDGRRMEGIPTKKSLYIVNGRKVITK